MKNILPLLLITLLAFGCKKSGSDNDEIADACGATTVEELAWANALVNNQGACTIYAGARLTAYTYNGQSVIHLSNPASSVYRCNQAVYNCSGTSLSENWTAGNWAEFEANRKGEKLFWEKP